MKIGGALKGLLGTVGPSLASAVGGPLAGSAVAMIAEKLGVKNDPVAVEKRLATPTPEALVELKALDVELAAKMAEAGIDLARLENEDRQDARQHFSKDWTSRLIAIMLVVGFLCYIMVITIQPPTENSEAVINLILGYTGGLVSAIVSFYFGAAHNGGKD